MKWIKSSYSTNDGPECVEVALTPETIHIRDSKDDGGPQFAVSPKGWADFLSYAAQR